MAAVTMKTVRNVRKLERPRPLRTTSTDSMIKSPPIQTLDLSTLKSGAVDNVLQDLEALHIHINNGNFDDSTISLLVQVCNQLKSRGQQLDLLCKEHLDRYFVTLRNASRDERLDMHSRMRLLEIIELRAMKWKTNENMSNYYKQKLLEMESPGYVSMLSQSATVPYMVPSMLPQGPTQTASFSLTQGEVLRSSGKFSKPTKIPGKNFFKDEIIIRNSDSGKVSPGARDRLVQITGPSDESISQAKVLIDDTIRRNASPVRQEKPEMGVFGVVGSESSTSLNSSVSEESGSAPILSTMKKTLTHSYSMGDATLGEYNYSVNVGTDTIRISGTKVDLVQIAKLVLEEYFAGQAELAEKVSTPTYHHYVPSNTLPMFETEAATKPDYGFSRQDSVKFDGVSGEKVNRWLLRSNSSSSGLGNRNGPLQSSSSEEETYKAEGSLTEDEKSPVVKGTEASPLTSPFTKTATLFFQPNQGIQTVTTDSIVTQKTKREGIQRSQSVNLDKAMKIKYTRDFLLDCALSPHSQIRPKEHAMFSAEAAAFIKESPKEFFHPSMQREFQKTSWDRRDSIRQSPPQEK